MNRRAALAKIRGVRPTTLALQQRTAARSGAALSHCPVPGCGRPPQARAGQGVSLVYCRFHAQLANRHGCHWKRTYRAAVLEPYRKAARRYLRTNPDDYWIVNALVALQELMDRAGPAGRVVDVHLMQPRAKARAALARMRRRDVPPSQLLVAYLAVCCAIAEDPVSPGSETANYRRVQAAKACARTAASERANYLPAHQRRYARSSGLALVHLGLMLEQACEHVREQHLPAILSDARAAAQAGDRL